MGGWLCRGLCIESFIWGETCMVFSILVHTIVALGILHLQGRNLVAGRWIPLVDSSTRKVDSHLRDPFLYHWFAATQWHRSMLYQSATKVCPRQGPSLDHACYPLQWADGTGNAVPQSSEVHGLGLVLKRKEMLQDSKVYSTTPSGYRDDGNYWTWLVIYGLNMFSCARYADTILIV